MIISMTQEKIDFFWDKIKDSPSILGILDARSKDHFQWLMTNAIRVLEYDFGYVRISDLEPGHYALVHGVFWSPQVYRNIDKIREDAMMLIDTLDIQYLAAIIPSKQRSLARLVEEIGFKKGPLLENYYRIPTGQVDGQVYILTKGE